MGTAPGDGTGEEDDARPEMTHKEPSYKNAQWLRKRQEAPRWTQKLCRLLEGLMEADETELETDIGLVVEDMWKIHLECNKSGKGALKAKIKEHKQKQRHREKKERKKERRKEKKARKSSKYGRGRRGSSDLDSSSSRSNSSSDSGAGSLLFGS